MTELECLSNPYKRKKGIAKTTAEEADEKKEKENAQQISQKKKNR